MIKKIKAEQLRPGMYVHDLDCGWLQHPFIRNSLHLKNQKTIDKILEHGIREVYIDTAKGLDVDEAPTAEEVRQNLNLKMAEMAEQEPILQNRITRDEELEEAKQVQVEAKKVVGDIMEDARMGQQIEKEKVEHMVEKMADSIFRNKDALISLGRIKQKDQYTFMHSVSVCVLMISFCRELGLDRDVINKVGIGALLHDVGKMQVPLEILNKPGRLTEEEFEKMKEHVELGCRILEETPGITEPSMLVVAEHHERYDGTGYPRGLKGEELSLYGQMASIVDVYDAMTSERCYRKAVEPTEVLRKIFEWSTHHFKEEMVHRFVRCVGIYPVGTLVRLESGLLGVVVEAGATGLLQPVVRVVYDTNERWFVPQYDIDLSLPGGTQGTHSIVCNESPDKWGISPKAYLEGLEDTILSASQ